MSYSLDSAKLISGTPATTGVATWNGTSWVTAGAAQHGEIYAAADYGRFGYAGGTGAYPYDTSTRWAFTLGLISSSFRDAVSGVSWLNATNPPTWTGLPNFTTMGVQLPAGEYFAIWSTNGGAQLQTGTVRLRQYSTNTSDGDPQYHGHTNTIGGDTRWGALNIARLDFTQTRKLYLRAVAVSGTLNSFPVQETHLTMSLVVLRIV